MVAAPECRLVLKFLVALMLHGWLIILSVFWEAKRDAYVKNPAFSTYPLNLSLTKEVELTQSA